MRSSAEPRQILVVIGSLQVGGTEQHLARVLPALVRRGWRVTLFTLAGDGPLRAPLQQAGVTVRFTPVVAKLLAGRFPVLRVLRLAIVMAHLVWLIRSVRPAVAHFFLPEAYVIGAFCALIAGVPRRIMSRRSLNRYQQAQPAVARMERWLHRRMSLIAGNSRAVLRELEAEGVPPSRLRLTYNGIELTDELDAGSRAVARAALALSPDALVLITVANLIPYKGHMDLLDALALVAGDMPRGWRLLCAGRDLGYGETLQQRVRQLGLDEHVLWLGGRADVAALLGIADIGVLASHQEGFSNAVLEAMAAALPMVVTDVGGNAEAVLDGATGCVVPAGQPAVLGQAILRLACDPALRRQQGHAARDRVAAHFTLDAAVDRYEELYEEVAGAELHKTEPAMTTVAAVRSSASISGKGTSR